MDEPLTIISLDVTNFARIKAVRIEPDPDNNTVVLTGRNGQGKSSVMDAIRFAIDAAGNKIDWPIHEGADGAEIVAVFGADGVPDLIVEKRLSASGKSSLIVKDADGIKQSSPAALLKNLFGRLSLDPFKFAQAKADEQVRILLDLVPDFDYQDWEDGRKHAFEKRTVANREVTRLQGALKSTPKPTTDETEPVSVSTLVADINARETVALKYESALGLVDQWEQRLAHLRAQVAEAEEQLSLGQAFLVTQAVPDPAKLDELKQQLASVDETNNAISQSNRYRETADLLEGATTYVEYLTAEIRRFDAGRDLALQQAALPITGLTFNDEGVIYNGVPFSRASRAEKEKISIALAIAARPRAGVILVEDASLLDQDSLAIVKDMATRHHMQVWLEVVNSTDSTGITIEDGEVA